MVSLKFVKMEIITIVDSGDHLRAQYNSITLLLVLFEEKKRRNLVTQYIKYSVLKSFLAFLKMRPSLVTMFYLWTVDIKTCTLIFIRTKRREKPSLRIGVYPFFQHNDSAIFPPLSLKQNRRYFGNCE